MAQTIEGQVDAVGEQLNEARSQQLHLIAPRHFQRAAEKLTEARRAIRELPDASIVVQGHTDARGHDEYNQSLSQRRAIAVREYLLANTSMSAERIRAEGYGETEPIATNDTEEGRSRNRRIDIVLDMTRP